MAMTLEALRTEIDTDPETLGYATLLLESNGPELVAAKLNEVGASGETLIPMWTPTDQITPCINRAEYEAAAITAAKRELLALLCSTPRVMTGHATIQASFAGIFASGTATRAALVALTTKPCSRAEALWGELTRITATHVADAVALPG